MVFIKEMLGNGDRMGETQTPDSCPGCDRRKACGTGGRGTEQRSRHKTVMCMFSGKTSTELKRRT